MVFMDIGMKMWFLLFFFAGTVVCQVKFVDVFGPVPGLSATCIQVLNATVSCDPSIRWAGDNRYESDQTLTNLCTTTCTNAINDYRRRVSGACGSSRYLQGDGYMYLAGYEGEVNFERYSLTCLKNSAGKFCNAALRDLLGIDSNNQHVTKPPSSTVAVACDSCVLSSLQARLQQPLASDQDTSAVFASLTSSCKSTGYTLSTPASSDWSVPASGSGITPTVSPTSTPGPATCVGTSITLKSGDTCQSVSLQNGVSTAQLLGANNLFPYCRKFPTSGALCIPSALKCKPYTLKTGDTCNSLSNPAATYAQLVSWNPELGRYCENIDHLASLHFTICLSNPGGSWVHPYPTNEPTTTSGAGTTWFDSIFTLTSMTVTAIPTPTSSVAQPNQGYMAPVANGTRQGCAVYRNPPVMVNSTTRRYSYACADVAAGYGVSLADLLDWNTGLNASSCQMDGNAQYCVQLDEIVSPGVTQYCVDRRMASPGDNCTLFGTYFNATVANLVEWNPGLGSNCANFKTGTQYCAAVRHFRPAGQISTCNRWAMANATSTSECGVFETKFNLQHARFVAWNPSVKSDCTGMVKYYDYCVGIPGFPV